MDASFLLHEKIETNFNLIGIHLLKIYNESFFFFYWFKMKYFSYYYALYFSFSLLRNSTYSKSDLQYMLLLRQTLAGYLLHQNSLFHNQNPCYTKNQSSLTTKRNSSSVTPGSFQERKTKVEPLVNWSKHLDSWVKSDYSLIWTEMMLFKSLYG